MLSSNRWPENSSKFTSFVRSVASTNRQACLSSRAAVPQLLWGRLDNASRKGNPVVALTGPKQISGLHR